MEFRMRGMSSILGVVSRVSNVASLDAERVS